MSYDRNADAFGKLVGVCAGYGGKYNPAQSNLQVNSLQKKWSDVLSALQDTRQASDQYRKAAGDFRSALDDLSSVAIRIRQALKVNPEMAPILKRCSYSLRKLAKNYTSNNDPPAAENKKAVVRIPGKGSIYKISHLESLVVTLSNTPTYKPEAEDLKIAGLKDRLEQLKKLRDKVISSNQLLKDSRKKRNKIFFDKKGGMVPTAYSVKNLVRSIFGFNSNEAASINSIRFITIS